MRPTQIGLVGRALQQHSAIGLKTQAPPRERESFASGGTHPDLHRRSRALRDHPEPRSIVREKAERGHRRSAGRAAVGALREPRPKPLITPIFPDFYRFFPVFPWTSGRVLWIPGVQTEKTGEKWGKMGKKWVKSEITGVEKRVLMHASAGPACHGVIGSPWP